MADNELAIFSVQVSLPNLREHALEVPRQDRLFAGCVGHPLDHVGDGADLVAQDLSCHSAQLWVDDAVSSNLFSCHKKATDA